MHSRCDLVEGWWRVALNAQELHNPECTLEKDLAPGWVVEVMGDGLGARHRRFIVGATHLNAAIEMLRKRLGRDTQITSSSPIEDEAFGVAQKSSPAISFRFEHQLLSPPSVLWGIAIMNDPPEDPFQKLVAERQRAAEQKKAAARVKEDAADALEKIARNDWLSSWQALQAARDHANRMFAAVNSDMRFHFQLIPQAGSSGVAAGIFHLAAGGGLPLAGSFRFLTNGLVNIEARTVADNFVDNLKITEADETYWRDLLLKYARAV